MIGMGEEGREILPGRRIRGHHDRIRRAGPSGGAADPRLRDSGNLIPDGPRVSGFPPFVLPAYPVFERRREHASYHRSAPPFPRNRFSRRPGPPG